MNDHDPITFESVIAARQHREAEGADYSRESIESDLQRTVDELREQLAVLPADWRRDSSLETWFPITAKELTALRAALERMRTEMMNFAENVRGEAEGVKSTNTIRARRLSTLADTMRAFAAACQPEVKG